MFLQAFPRRLRAARAAANYTQLSIAEKLACHVDTIASWERGRTVPDAHMVARLATLYSVSADWLLTGHAALPHEL